MSPLKAPFFPPSKQIGVEWQVELQQQKEENEKLQRKLQEATTQAICQFHHAKRRCFLVSGVGIHIHAVSAR